MKKQHSLARHEARWAYALISPWLIGFIIFTAGPMIASLVLSLTNYDIVHAPQFVGLSKYSRMLLKDPKFWHSLWITVKYAIIDP